MPDRTVVAISNDREWLVVLDKHPSPANGRMFFSIYAWDGVKCAHTEFDFARDTGQSAEDVLREFLERRGT